MAVAGISTVGVKVGYAVESTSGTQPSSFTALSRINSVGNISLSSEQIDASALEDLFNKNIAGRQDTGGTFTITVNMTNETVTEWETLIAAAKAGETTGLNTWFTVYSPYLTKAFFIVAQPPRAIPMPEFSQNGLQTVEMELVINDYKGMLTAVEPS